MSNVPYPMPLGPRPPLRHVVIRFDPEDAHPKITELCLRERETHDRGEHEHIDFIPTPAADRLPQNLSLPQAGEISHARQ